MAYFIFIFRYLVLFLAWLTSSHCHSLCIMKECKWLIPPGKNHPPLGRVGFITIIQPVTKSGLRGNPRKVRLPVVLAITYSTPSQRLHPKSPLYQVAPESSKCSKRQLVMWWSPKSAKDCCFLPQWFSVLWNQGLSPSWFPLQLANDLR